MLWDLYLINSIYYDNEKNLILNTFEQIIKFISGHVWICEEC